MRFLTGTLVLAAGSFLVAGTTPDTRPATSTEQAFCEANYDTLGPVTDDCSRVPFAGGITEDDPWGRWDCRTMGNHRCTKLVLVNVDGELHAYDAQAPDRPR